MQTINSSYQSVHTSIRTGTFPIHMEDILICPSGWLHIRCAKPISILLAPFNSFGGPTVHSASRKSIVHVCIGILSKLFSFKLKIIVFRGSFFILLKFLGVSCVRMC